MFTLCRCIYAMRRTLWHCTYTRHACSIHMQRTRTIYAACTCGIHAPYVQHTSSMLNTCSIDTCNMHACSMHATYLLCRLHARECCMAHGTCMTLRVFRVPFICWVYVRIHLRVCCNTKQFSARDVWEMRANCMYVSCMHDCMSAACKFHVS